MKEKRDIQVGIKSDKGFFDELKELAGRIDGGWLPEKPVERLYFDDLPSLLKHLTPKRFELLAERTSSPSRRSSVSARSVA